MHAPRAELPAEFPGLLLFACLSPAASGGDTALADATAVLEALPADLVQRFERELRTGRGGGAAGG